LVSKIYECIFYDTEKDKLYSRTIKPKVNKY